jgi:hypothetical protein
MFQPTYTLRTQRLEDLWRRSMPTDAQFCSRPIASLLRSHQTHSQRCNSRRSYGLSINTWSDIRLKFGWDSRVSACLCHCNESCPTISPHCCLLDAAWQWMYRNRARCSCSSGMSIALRPCRKKCVVQAWARRYSR